MITAVTMARSLIETVALAHAVSQDIKLASEEENFIKANEVLNSAMLSSRHPVFAQAAALEPTRVTKLVARIDSEFLESSTLKVNGSVRVLMRVRSSEWPGLVDVVRRWSILDRRHLVRTQRRTAGIDLQNIVGISTRLSRTRASLCCMAYWRAFLNLNDCRQPIQRELIKSPNVPFQWSRLPKGLPIDSAHVSRSEGVGCNY